MNKRKFTREAKIGIMTIIGIALLYIGVNYLKGINLFQPANSYYILFNNVEGVTISSPVFIDGFKVGLVRSMSYDYREANKIRVEISLDDKVRINRNSYSVIEKELLGGAKLHLNLNRTTDEYLKPGETLEGRMSEGMLGSVTNDILPSFVSLIPKIDSILTGIQTLLNHPALSQSLTNLESTTRNLDASSRQLNVLLSRDIPVVLADFKNMSANFSQLSADLKSLDLQTTINSINATLSNIKQTTDHLNSKENSLGLLLNDRELYNNLNGTIDNASKLLIDLKENPKRYVHFSLF
ncbi:MAG: MlaD family protein [Tannerellaceae bacterium]|jgi:phospholipid/cholesterol/gamma-HCH transport system substrate-binding protein|nr:MlaD family protein [Tannerellaceae bacterium]